MRGRLIFPFIAEIVQLDTVATAADPDAGGPLTSGYDDVFRELVKLPDGTDARVDTASVRIPCQVEVETYEQQLMRRSGGDNNAVIRLVFHFEDLENMGLVDLSTGLSKIKVNDRPLALYHQFDGSLAQKLDGFYITEAQPQSFGLTGLRRNLLVCTCQGRDQGYSGGAAA